MADDRWTTWQAEMAGTSPLPGVVQVLALFAAVALVLISLLGGATATAEGGRVVDHRDAPASTVPACAQHFPPTSERR